MLPLDEALQGLLFHCAAQALSPRTSQFYRDRLGRFFVFCKLKDLRHLEDVPKVTAQEFLLGLDCSQATRNGYTRAIRRLARWAEEEGLCITPLARLKLGREPKRVRTVLGQKELERFLAACAGPNQLRDRALALFLYDTACRSGEARTLTLENLHLKEGFALVRGKGDRERVVPFGARTTEALWKYLRSKHRPASPLPYVFLTRRGTGLTDNIALEFAKIGRRAGLERANPHLFRHSAVTGMLRNGMSTAQAKEIAGHSTVAVTEGYSHLTAEDARTAHRKAGPVDHGRA